MKKFNKRMMALLVAFIMLLNLCPSFIFSVAAEEFTEEYYPEYSTETDYPTYSTETDYPNYSTETDFTSAKEIYVNQTEMAYTVGYDCLTYFSFTPTESGIYNFTSLASEDTYGYLYDSNNNWLSDNDDGGDANNFLISYYMLAGETYYFGVRFYNGYNIGSFPVKLTKALGIKEITFAPTNIVEYTCGYIADDYDEDTDSYEEYFCYEWWDEISYTVTFDNGRESSGEGTSFYDENGMRYELSYSDDQFYYNVWTVGNTYYPTVSVAGYETTVPITIVKTPIKSFTVAPITIVEHTNGRFESEWNDETEKPIQYYFYDVSNKFSYTVTFNNGSTLNGNGNSFCDEDGNYYSMNYRFEQSAQNPWTVSNTYFVDILVAGFEVRVPVTIIESPVESIEFAPLTVIENTKGHSEYGWDENGYYIEYYYYDLHQLRPSYTVTFKDGTIGKYENFGFSDDNGNYYEVGYDYDQSACTPWKAGNTYYATFDVAGIYVEVPITILESPIVSFTVDPIYLNSETDGYVNEYCDEYNCYYYTRYDWFNKCVINVTLSDGSTVNFMGHYFEYNGESYPITHSDNQDMYNSWSIGGTYSETVYLLGKSADVEITVLEQKTSEGIRYMIQNGCAIIVGLSDSGESITIPEYIDGYPVVAITSLSGGNYDEIIIPDYITSISTQMLDECYGLKKIVIGAGVTALNNRTFQNAYDLEEIVISEDNPEYASDDGILYDKDKTRMVAIPVNKTTDHLVPKTANNIELYINGTYHFNIQLQNDASGYVKEDGVLYNKEKTVVYSCDPDKTGDYKMPDTVQAINNCAFKGSNLESVTISQNVSEIVYYAFAESGSLKQVVLPDNLNAISTHAFADCPVLTDVKLPSSLAILDDNVFRCTNIKKITIPSGVKEIGYGAFYNSSLEEVTISEGVASIGAFAFEGTNLKDVTLPKSILNIDDMAFFGSTLQNVKLNAGLEAIGKNAFANTELTEISIPNTVTYIGGDAFRNTNINKLKLEEGITTIDDYAFRGLGIESLELPKSVTDIAYKSFQDCYNLTNVDLPDNIESLDGTAFDGTPWYDNQPLGLVYLENALYRYKGDMPENSIITVDDGTKIVADYAFSAQYNLTTVKLPKSLKTIGDCAFLECYGLTDVYYGGSESDRARLNIGEENYLLENATWHYTYDYDNADCTHEYDDDCDEMCNNCAAIRIPSHNYVNGVCRNCRTRLESKHDYENNTDQIWFIGKENCESISITFSDLTYIEDGWDFIYIYDGEDNLIGKYTGDELAGETVTVMGDMIQIRLCTDRIGTEYGFKVINVVYNCAHVYGNDGCIYCGAYLESDHDYPVLFDKTWEVCRKDALSLTLAFSPETYVEEGYDFIYVYDGNDNLIGQFTGAELASNSVTVIGDTAKIRLTSDRIETGYGFRVTSIFAEYTGDINGDCVVNAEDLVYIRTLILSNNEDISFDLNDDGVSDIKDIVRLKKILVGM